MNANSLLKSTAASHADPPAEDEWGFFDPKQTGSEALAGTLGDQALGAVDDSAALAPPSDAPSAAHCRYCTETLTPGARHCPLCLREVGDRPRERMTTGEIPSEIPSTPPAACAERTMPLSGKQSFGAVYSLESPVRCPECDVEIGSINVLRVLRTQVSFTSTLPRKAYVIACPECRRLLSAGLSGLL